MARVQRLRKSEPIRNRIVHDLLSQADKISQTIDAIDRLTGSVDRLSNAIEGLGPAEQTRYTPPANSNADLVDEGTMAEMLGIKRRTLGKYRRQGKLPACWIKNGSQVRWHANETLDAWKRGVA